MVKSSTSKCYYYLDSQSSLELAPPRVEAEVAVGGMETPHQKTQYCSAPDKIDRRHQTSRWEPLEISGPGPWILDVHQ
ncbi:jg3252 [Pararge aegeria aegeria]|uniref:Jg3252 protein n=1 Tax=Pararge aegeria aegeria TaxID=348720 RepID=A0A8S4RTI1_9NEOP|nr:jg3252 [Pararge aegeria aegeria]